MPTTETLDGVMTNPPQYPAPGAHATYGRQPVPYPADPGPAPKAVRSVLWLVIVQYAIAVVFSIPVAYASKDAFLAQQPATPGVDQDTIFEAGVVIGVLIALGVAALWILFAVKIRQGRNWARITMLVWGGISLLLTPINLFGGMSNTPVTPLTVATTLVGTAFTVAILVLLVIEPTKSWTPAKTAYLKAHRF